MTIGTPSPPNYLDDGGLAYAPTGGGSQTGYGEVSGAAANYAFPSGATSWNGVVIINVTALNTATGDEVYQLEVQGSLTSAFSATQTLGLVTVAAVGQYAVPVAAYTAGVFYPYMRLAKHVSGTNPSITLNAFPLAFSGLDDLTAAQAYQLSGLASQNILQLSAAVLAWATGVAGGGPNSDGRYPLYDASGSSFLVLCPAAAGFTPAAVDALPTAVTSTDTNPNWAVSVDGATTGSRVLKKVNFFPARRTQDLTDITTLLGSEVFPAYSAAMTSSGGAAGEYGVSLGVMGLGLTGVINPKLPPYNCKGDLQEVRDAYWAAGSNVITSPSGQFKSSDVGKLGFTTGSDTNYAPGTYTITSYISPTQVGLDRPAAVYNGGRFAWGTDDTTGMQAALNAIWGQGSYSYGKALMLPPGGYICGPLLYGPRCAVVGVGGRTSYFFRKPTAQPSSIPTDQTQSSGLWYPYGTTQLPLMCNHDVTDDFPCFINVGFHGGFYYQCYQGNYTQSDCFVYNTVDGNTDLPQIDPYPWFAGVRVWEASSNGVQIIGRNAGTVLGMEALNCHYAGLIFQCYDNNINGLHVEANGWAGISLINSAANNNLINVKCSFNGQNGYDQTTGCNMFITGGGNNIVSARLQESWGSNLVVAGGYNKFNGLNLDDTGDIYPATYQGSSSLLPYRAAVAFIANTAANNYLFNAVFGPSVRSTSYATHGIFTSDNASSNYGTLFAPSTNSYYGSGTGAYAPGPAGSDSSGGFGASNVFTINGVSVS